MKRLLSFIFAFGLVLEAYAYPTPPGIYGGPASGPVLADVSINFGALTPAGRGGVSLASQDNSSYGYAFSGLNLWDGNAAATPVSWTIEDTTATAGYTPGTHWRLDGTTTCKLSATVASLTPATPRPCAAGVTAQLNKGPYTFSVTATDALGRTSAPKTLTVNIIADAVNVGDQVADIASGALPTAWTSGTVPADAKVLFSTGANRINVAFVWQNLDFSGTNRPVLTLADVTKPAGIGQIQLKNVKKFGVDGIIVTGPGTPVTGNADFLLTGGADDIVITDSGSIKDLASVTAADGSTAILISGATNVTISGFTARYRPHCLKLSGSYAAPVEDITVNELSCRYIYENFITIGTSADVTLNDTRLIAPMRKDGAHADCVQISNSASPRNLSINRLLCVQADGDAATQGPPFGGTLGIQTGYIDNGTPGEPGNTLHVTSSVVGGQFPLTNGALTGARLVSTTDSLGASITPGTQTVTGTCVNPTVSVPVPSCTISGDPQLVGSAADPVTIFTAPFENFQVNGLIYAGATFAGFSQPGEAGTSFIKNFTHVKSNGYNNGADFAGVYFTGSVAPGVVGASTYNVVTAGPTSGATIMGIVAGQRLTYPSALGAPCNLTATTNFPATCTSPGNILSTVGGNFGSTTVRSALGLTGMGAEGTYAFGTSPALGTVAEQGMVVTFDYPVSGGPNASMYNTDQPLVHTGTFTISSGFMWDSLNYLQTYPRVAGTKPANTTIEASVFFGGLTADGYEATHALALATFDAGDPQAILDAIPTATWAGYTDDQVAATYATAMRPKAGGILDAGGGLWWGALTGSGQWNDGSGKSP